MKTIAWDVDDVLNDLMRSWLEQKWTKEHRACVLKYSDLTANPPHRLLGVGAGEYLRSLDEFRLSSAYQQMGPTEEVLEWFARYGYRFRHIALTAVPLIAAPASAQWVFKHFGAWIRTFHIVPSHRRGQQMPEYEKDKGDFLMWISKVDLLIDDSVSNIMSLEKTGCKGILMPRPWNQSKISIAETLSMIIDMV